MDLRHSNRIWGTKEGVVNLSDGHSPERSILAVIPMAFISSLNLRSRYLKRVAQCLVEQQDLELWVGKERVDDDDTIISATYFVLAREASAEFVTPDGLVWKTNPTDKSGKRKLQERDDSSTVSKSSRQSRTQDRFRKLVTARDAAECVITGESDAFGREVDACHIVPKTRGDELIRKILRDETILIDDVTNGLLMSKSLHGSFDFYEWGIYVEDGVYQVHSFVGKRCKDLGHGRNMFTRKGSYWRDMWPDDRLVRITLFPHADDSPPYSRRTVQLSWHYEQCVKARLRPHTSS